MSEIILPYHEKQAEMFSFKTRFLVGDTGRQFGKSVGLGGFLCEETHRVGDGMNNTAYYIGPKYTHCEDAFNKFLAWSEDPENTIKEIMDKPKYSKPYELRFKTRNKIIFRSGENPDALPGGTLAALGIDESGLIKDEVFNISIRPALMRHEARAAFVGTPGWSKWYQDRYKLALAGDPDYTVCNFSTYDNPYLNPEEVTKAINEMMAYSPELVRQQFYGEFVTLGGLFGDLSPILIPFSQANMVYTPGHYYSMGVDPAEVNDDTDIHVFDCTTGTSVETRTIHGGGKWAEKEEAIVDLNQKWGYCPIKADGSNQSSFFERLREDHGLDIDIIRIHRGNKPNLVNNLSSYIARKQVFIPIGSPQVDAEGIMEQCGSFATKILESGHIRYGAKGGAKDDKVMAYALAVMPYIDFVKPDADRAAREIENSQEIKHAQLIHGSRLNYSSPISGGTDSRGY
jgi:hypothetical protein